ncbi:MAG: oligopeptide/dipeptide ABC transporter ATP-binding protein, partial [Halobacteriaceae archaeon]
YVKGLLDTVGLNPAQHYDAFPHELSGGQRQRVGIARALALQPSVIIADEPVSALDVSIQAQILNLLDDLQEKFDLTLLFITHDMSVVRQIADRIIVMYLGKFVEIGQTDAIFSNPTHPYTEALLSSIPRFSEEIEEKNDATIEGTPPDPTNPPSGCNYHPRCHLKPKCTPKEQEECESTEPGLEVRYGRDVACHHRTISEDSNR